VTAGYLLDTNAALLAVTMPERLSATARAAVEAGPNTLSVLSYWEVLLKSRKGKLDVGDPRSWWVDALDQLAARVLPLQAQHVTAIHLLPAFHQDPFDRALIAQATIENLTLVTTNAEIPRYASDRFHVVQ
jgi:PIN domain nuclease of toxin-antitoxin system